MTRVEERERLEALREWARERWEERRAEDAARPSDVEGMLKALRLRLGARYLGEASESDEPA